MGQDQDAIEREIEERRERIGERIDALRYKTDVKGRVGDGIAEKRDQATGRVRELVSAAREQASRADDGTPDAEEVKRQTRRAAGIVRENPLGLALGAVAAGFLLRLLLPSTPMEDENLGGRRRREGQSGGDRKGGARTWQAGRSGRGSNSEGDGQRERQPTRRSAERDSAAESGRGGRRHTLSASGLMSKPRRTECISSFS
jgi:ElaB/YqjD/DUF883 family membrane-anchored ribosome-binding protein